MIMLLSFYPLHPLTTAGGGIEPGSAGPLLSEIQENGIRLQINIIQYDKEWMCCILNKR